ncbi:hypothetical protein LGH82_33210 [Mesorhizobium sp. PAMC28654]|uniref:hypothetical protein n=1 Tax=Mesorhizobium sp. PAMC28654 TaxID=2880934 RepID=UPI001D0B418C|nr:hypothetical protein [Mesorhizobium sp. PAMC28654]UDL89839.1 hypothetical protein LGH82_33210 [Mesorhizobium sp. PAMC28654]
MPDPIITAPVAPVAPVAPIAPVAPAAPTDWVSGIPEGVARDHVVSKGYKTPGDLAAANYNLMRIHSGSGDVIEKLKADASPQQQSGWYKTVNGIGADTKYDLKFADGLQVDQTYVETAKNWFKDAGLRPDQAQLLADKNNEWVQQAGAKMAEEAKAKNELGIAQLKSKYEAQGAGQYDQLIASGAKAAKALGLSAEMLGRLDAANGVAANLELLAVLGERMGVEAPFRDGAPSISPFSNPEGARVELAKMSGDKAFVDSLMNPKDPMHAVNTRKHSDLQRIAYAKK